MPLQYPETSMPASRAAEPSALRTGVSHFAASFLVFGGLTAGAAGAVQAFGSAETVGPVVEIALFEKGDGAAPLLKNRLEGDIEDPAATHEPSLDVAEYGEDGEPLEASFTVTEIGETGEIKQVRPQPLPRAPLDGLFERTPAGNLPKIAANGTTPAAAYARPFTGVSGQPKISLVVGGLGLNKNHTLSAINDLPPEVTLSFVPYADNLQTWVARAREAGHEVLLELPMEAYDYPNVDTGPQTLLTSVSADENKRRLNLLLGKATGYFGVTNYQGGKFATDIKSAGPVLAALKSRGLVFLHDGAANRSALPDAAQQTGASVTVANRIVDAEPSADSIDRELLQLEALAIQNGQALGVGYAYPVTIEQFRIWAQGLKAKGYQLAPASAVMGVHAAPSAKAHD
jgi:polysaccharide deacetylase 2 family uncharacterized protein YibQ